MTQSHDLTAERAAATLTLLKRKRLQSDAAKEQVICAALKTARQEALREAIAIIRQAETWTPQSVLAILECLARDTKPDRLASEGG